METFLIEFLKDHPECYDGLQVMGRCHEISTKLCNKLGANCSVVVASGLLIKNNHPLFKHIPKNQISHSLVKFENKFIDFTFRQFDKSSEVPKIFSEDQLATVWSSF